MFPHLDPLLQSRRLQGSALACLARAQAMSPAGAGGTGGAVVKKQKQLDILSMRGFASGISAEEKVKQDERDDAKWRERQALRKAEEERKEAARLANKRKPGRPPKKPTIIAISDDGDSREPAPKKVKAPGDKRQYTNWYVPLPFGPIHSAVASCSSYLRAVKYLQLHNADGRYDNLGESTVRKWYEQGSYTELTATAKAAVRKQCAMVRPYAGNKAALFKHPEAQTSIITVLQDMQTTGQLINSPLASSIIVGVLEAEAPTVLVRNGGNLLVGRYTFLNFAFFFLEIW